MIEFKRVHEWDGANWQVVFLCETRGKVSDYCRETMPGTMSRDAIEAWAQRKLGEHRNLCGARIEKW